MDTQQRSSLLMAIAISSSSSPVIISNTTVQNRADALHTLEQFKVFDGRMPFALEFLQADRHIINLENGEAIDITAAVKLFSLGILESYIRTLYSQALDSERNTFRASIVLATRQVVQRASSAAGNNSIDMENRLLGMKLAALLADTALREFPQRWTSFIDDLFAPVQNGGLWCTDDCLDGDGSMIGVKIGLECLKLITEDCTDSDFNSKVSATRRNDVLIGLNEVRDRFLPSIFNLLSLQFTKLTTAKKSICEMELFLHNSARNIMQLTSEERTLYDGQITRRDAAGRMTADCLATIERFCQYMPIEWITSRSNGCDFVTALLHLLREDTWNIQVLSASCLEQLSWRKLELEQWIQFTSTLPTALGEANSFSNLNDWTTLVDKLPFHRIVSRTFASLLSSHLAYISTNKDLTKNRGPFLQVLSPFLDLMTEMLSHPSPIIAGEQLNAWIALLREPVITKSQTKILQPFLERVLNAYIIHVARLRWEDVEERTHPLTDLLEATWCDKDEYETFLSELRSKVSQLFKMIGSVEPEIAVVTLQRKLNSLLQTYGQGNPKDNIDMNTLQLTMYSESVTKLEAIVQPLDYILQGLPSWSLGSYKISDKTHIEHSRIEIRHAVKAALGNVAEMIIGWNPSDICLKFRRATMLEALKYYWQYEPETLGIGVDSLLTYLNADYSLPTSGSMTAEPLSDNVVALRKKSGAALISVSKCLPHLLVSFLGPLCDRAKFLLSSNSLLPNNEMHLYEFLSCVATAIDDPVARSTFIADVLANALNKVNSPPIIAAVESAESLLSFMGISSVAREPSLATNPQFVQDTTSKFMDMFSSFNQLLSVGKRCHEAAKKRPNGGLPLSQEYISAEVPSGCSNFYDEGPISIKDLLSNDPFVALWPDIFPRLLQCFHALLGVWDREVQAVLLRDPLQRFSLAISDDELYLAKKQDKCDGGVFGRAGTAGSVIAGWDRRSNNIVAKWSGWFNELRAVCFQFLGLASSSRVLFSPELASFYPQFVQVIVDRSHLLSMEHRHITQYMKHFLELLLLSCPSTLYQSHLTPILAPFFKHIQYRLQITWAPMFEKCSNFDQMKPLTTGDCLNAAIVASSGEVSWIMSYYPRGGLFIGDTDTVLGEAMSEKVRVDLNRQFSDMLQIAFALKGDWALVLANQTKDDQIARLGDKNKLSSNQIILARDDDGPINADGTPRTAMHVALDARKNLRIQKLCHYLLLDEAMIAEPLVLAVIDSLQYPDAYTCRRCTKLGHRIIETVAWADYYTDIIGNRLFSILVRAIVTEPKWMVGIEWELINLIRDIYCRLVLGQTLLVGGQGPGMEHTFDQVYGRFEQAKTVDNPLQGGGLLCIPSALPRQVLVSLPGITLDVVLEMEKNLTLKRSSKEQKDVLRDLLRLAAEQLKVSESKEKVLGMFSRATESESLLSQHFRKPIVPNLPEKLITYSMAKRAEDKEKDVDVQSLDDFL